MAMKNFVCWDPDRVNEIVNIDADHVDDDVFWAIHVESPILVRGASQNSPRKTMNAEELLSKFLDSRRPHFQLAVLGQTGTGKSHLIHWMRQRIYSDEKRVVLSVRRLETNLRAILDKLIDQLPNEMRSRFVEELNQAGTTLNTKDGQKKTLLNNLSVAIGEDQVQKNSGIKDDIEKHLIDHLPNLFIDPYLRKNLFLKDEQITDQLVGRLFSTTEGRREAERLDFLEEHLPKRNVAMQEAAAPTRDILLTLLDGTGDFIPPALKIINRNLPHAISRSMNFSGDRLAELLRELRISLKEQDKELVLLFEEFARFQGYDMALLDALQIQGGNELCNIRWAIACTTGFYGDFPDTARGRTKTVVDMDAVIDGDADPNRPIYRFTGQYMNAVRLGKSQIEKLFKNEPDTPVINACEKCEHVENCHKIFGKSPEGFGLYPFTETALQVIRNRILSDDQDGSGISFKPRDFQELVLVPMLEDGGKSIKTGTFPSVGLHDAFGGVKEVKPILQEQLEKQFGKSAKRYVTLLDIWSGLDPDKGLPSDMLEAFDLKALPRGEGQGDDEGAEKKKEKAKEKKEEKKEEEEKETEKLPKDIAEIRAWAGGGTIKQNSATNLRKHLYALVVSAIDWDAIGLQPKLFTQATGAAPFGQTSFNFRRQELSEQVRAVKITLPFEDSEASNRRSAIALEGLLQAVRHGGWDFDDGAKMQVALFELIDHCANEVTKKLRGLQGEEKKWDPVAGAVELLAVTAALSGEVTELPDLLSSCFKKPQNDQTFVTPKFQTTFDKLVAKHDSLSDFVRAHISGTKGGAVGDFIDPRQPISALETLASQGWKLQQQPVDLGTQFYKSVGDLYREVSETLPGVLEEECSTRIGWLEDLRENIGDTSLEDVDKSLKDLLAATFAEGLNVSEAEELRTALSDFANQDYKEAFTQLEHLETEGHCSISLIGLGKIEPLLAAAKLISCSKKVMNKVDKEIKVREGGQDQSEQKITKAINQMTEALNGVVDEISAIEGLSNAN